MAYLVTGALITSELIFIADYRTFG